MFHQHTESDIISGCNPINFISQKEKSNKFLYGRTGTEVVCYESPRPVLGIHRLVFLLFQQLGRQTVYAPGWRQNFSTRDFAELYNLGLPVAAVYFNCQRESGTGGRRMWIFSPSLYMMMTYRSMHESRWMIVWVVYTRRKWESIVIYVNCLYSFYI